MKTFIFQSSLYNCISKWNQIWKECSLDIYFFWVKLNEFVKIMTFGHAWSWWFCVVMRYYHHIAVLFLRVLYVIAEILQRFVLNTNQSINLKGPSASLLNTHLEERLVVSKSWDNVYERSDIIKMQRMFVLSKTGMIIIFFKVVHVNDII